MGATEAGQAPARVLVGGVGQLYQGDLDLGRVAVERLAAADLGRGVLVEDLHYGAVAVAQRLQEVAPGALVLIGAEERGRPPASVERRRVHPVERSPRQVQAAVGDAVTGYVGIDLVIEVGQGLGGLPRRTVAIEVEPADTSPSEALSPLVIVAFQHALDLVRAEVRRAPLLELADQLRSLLDGARLEASPALEAMAELLAELDVLDEQGRWGATFSCRDRLRIRIASGETGDDMDTVDWALWWALIEELDRLQAVESV